MQHLEISLATVLTSIALLSGCGDDSEGGGTAGGTDDAPATDTRDPGPSSGSNSGSNGETGTATIDQGSSSSGDSGGPVNPTGSLAGGIQIGDVIANQAVDITLVREGALVPAASREAPLIAGRPLLLRTGYELDPDFTARTLIGRLTIETSDGTTVFDDVRAVSGPSQMGTLDGTFHWIVPPDGLPADASFRIDIFEEEDLSTIGTLGRATVPEGGSAPLDAWGDPMVLDIVLVPFSCGGIGQVDITPQDLADFEAYIFNTYPITELNLEVHDVVASSSCSEFDAAEYDLPALRESESPEPWVYYGGLLPGDGGGYSIAIGDSDQMGFRRTFANHTWRWYGLTFDLFAHELGHNHGREHSFEDPSFEGDNSGYCGSISGHGWGVTPGNMPKSGFSNDQELGLSWIDPNAELLPPTPEFCDGAPNANENLYNDIMSYAYPYWVSAYTYAALADRVRLISSWRGTSAPPTQDRELVRFVVDTDGRVHESRRLGALSPSHPSLWAKCGAVRVPVSQDHAIHDRRDADGRLVEDLYATYTFEVPAGVDATSCTVQTNAGTLRAAF